MLDTKYTFTIIIYKKKSNTEPSHFRPIIPQPISAKIYSPLIRNRIYGFLIKNDFIKTRIQKGFKKGISRIFEDIELLSHDQPGKKQTTPNYCYVIRPKICVW